MSIKFQTIFSSLEPYRVVADLGLPIEAKSGSFYTQHPLRPSTTLQIIESGFVSNEPTCDFVAGNVCDFLALHFGSYEKGLGYLLAQYPMLSDKGSGYALNQLQESLVHDLIQARNTFNGVLKLRSNLRLHNQKLHDVFGWLRQKGISASSIWKIVYAAKGSEINALMNYVTEADEFNSNASYIIFPYFANYHTAASLHVYPLDEKIQHRVVHMTTDYRHAFFGMHSCYPDLQFHNCYSNHFKAATAFSTGSELGQINRGHACVEFQPSGVIEGIKLNKGIAVIDDATNINDLVRIRSVFTGFHISDAKHNIIPRGVPASIPWEDYVARQFQQMLLSDGSLTPRISLFVESIKQDRPTCDALIQWLKVTGRAIVAKQIQFLLDSRQTYIRPNGMLISETPGGYVARVPGKPGDNVFTNFLIKVDQNVWFEETKEIYHLGRICIGGHDYPFFISNRHLNKPGQIAHLASTAVMSAQQGDDGPFPVVLDASYKNHLAAILSQQVSGRARVIGIKRLGWNLSKTAFITPTWQARIPGVEPTSKVRYPDAPVFERNYVFKDFSRVEEYPDVPLEARSLIAIVAAMLGRAYSGRDIPVVRVNRADGMLQLISGVFLALGQQSAIELNPNRRVNTFDPEYFQGYPVLATTADETLLSGLKSPIILMSTSGMAYSDRVTNAVFQQIYAMSHKMLSSVAVGLLRNQGNGYQISADQNDHALLLEGKSIIEAYSDTKSFSVFDDRLPILKSLLTSTPFESLPSIFKFDLTAQCITIDTTKLGSDIRTGLQNELSTYTECVPRPRNRLRVKVAWITTELEKFYGRPVMLFHQGDDAPQATEDPAPAARSEIS